MTLKDHDFKGLGDQLNLMNTINGGVTMTQVEFGQNEHGMYLNLSNPAFESDNYHVELKPNVLTIFTTLQAEPAGASEEEDKTVVPTFIRNFPIPNILDPQKLEATFEDGILTIFAPYKEGLNGNSRKIDIQHL